MYPNLYLGFGNVGSSVYINFYANFDSLSLLILKNNDYC